MHTQRGAGPTEELLLRHLLGHHKLHRRDPDKIIDTTPLRLYDFPLTIVRPSPDSSCQGVPALGFPCLLLGGATGWNWPLRSSEECVAAATLAVAAR